MKRIEIPLSAPDITDAEIEAVVSVLRTSRLSLGPKMAEFEAAMAAYVGAPHAIAVSSGTAGLHLALLALCIGPGDEVIVPSFTFIAVANAVRYVGAQPVFADIDPETLNLDPASVEAAITTRTRALIAVHTFGRPAPMAALLDIARRHNLLVVEDACEAIGAEIAGRHVGTLADAGIFAFYPNKQLTTGEGGMVVTGNSEVAQRIAALRNHGRYKSVSGSPEVTPEHRSTPGSSMPNSAITTAFPRYSVRWVWRSSRASTPSSRAAKPSPGAIAICCATTHTCCCPPQMFPASA